MRGIVIQNTIDYAGCNCFDKLILGYFVLLLAAGLFLFAINDISIAKTKCKEMLAGGRTQG